MASMTIRDIDAKLKVRLRMRAASNGRSMEEEARDILRTALTQTVRSGDLVGTIRSRIEAAGGVDLEIPRREAMSEQVELPK